MPNLWGLKNFPGNGFSRSDLVHVNMDMRAANKNPINIIGAFKALIKGKSPSSEIVSSTCLVYISDCVNDFFLSYDTMLDLGIVDRSFPTVGACTQSNPVEPKIQENQQYVRSINSGCSSSQGEHVCNCPQRESIPRKPSSLSFAAIPENNGEMRDWLLEWYSKSTFNTCPPRPLPCMTGPPVEMHVDETAKPKTYHTAAPIPLHWQDKVLKDLEREEALGVIEKVPYGEPVTWCHRMVVTRKHDGSLAREEPLISPPLTDSANVRHSQQKPPFHLQGASQLKLGRPLLMHGTGITVSH